MGEPLTPIRRGESGKAGAHESSVHHPAVCGHDPENTGPLNSDLPPGWKQLDSVFMLPVLKPATVNFWLFENHHSIWS